METLFETTTGSRAYGLALETSDCDVLRVVAHGPGEYLGLTPYKESAHFKNGKDDVTVWDVRFYGKLLCAGNPNAVLPLFFDRTNYAVFTKEFEKFALNRRFFLGPNTIYSFRGMAQNTAQKFWDDNTNMKAAANALYLYQALKDLALYGGLGLSANKLAFLRAVKKGQVEFEEVQAALKALERGTEKESLSWGGVFCPTHEQVFENVNREVTAILKNYA